MEEIKGAGKKKVVLEIVKAIIIAIIISLLLILLMSLFIVLFDMPEKAIVIINQVIKGVSILVACLISLRVKGNGWLRGIIVGLIYILLAFLLFSLLDGNFKADIGLLNDAALGAVSGMVSGIIAMAIRSGKQY